MCNPKIGCGKACDGEVSKADERVVGRMAAERNEERDREG